MEGIGRREWEVMELDLMEWEEKRRMEFGEDDFWRDGRY